MRRLSRALSFSDADHGCGDDPRLSLRQLISHRPQHRWSSARLRLRQLQARGCGLCLFAPQGHPIGLRMRRRTKTSRPNKPVESAGSSGRLPFEIGVSRKKWKKRGLQHWPQSRKACLKRRWSQEYRPRPSQPRLWCTRHDYSGRPAPKTRCVRCAQVDDNGKHRACRAGRCLGGTPPGAPLEPGFSAHGLRPSVCPRADACPRTCPFARFYALHALELSLL